MNHLDPEKRHDFVFLFDVTDGNPNGDPDAGNLPRTDPETMQGLVTDVCVKRKIRDYVDAGTEKKIYVRDGAILQNEQKKAYEALDLENKKADRSEVGKARAWMCQEFFDVRMFGAMMAHKEFNSGKVTGPMQLTFSRSIDPITPMDVTITRSVPLSEESQEEKGNTMFGRKQVVPYGLYRGKGFYSPMNDTGVSKDDLETFWQALQMCWETDRSAARGMMACCGVYIFTHENPLGNAPARRLFNRLHISKTKETPRSFEDYDIDIDESDLPEGVSVTTLVA